MSDDLYVFLTKHKEALHAYCAQRLDHIFGDKTDEWMQWLLKSFYLTLIGKQSEECKFAKEGYAPAKSILILDEVALVLRSYLFDHAEQSSPLSAWSESIDRCIIEMHQRCLQAIQPDVASILFSNTELIHIINKISQAMFQEHTENRIFDVISNGLREYGLHIAVFKISSDFTKSKLHFSNYSREVNQHFIESAGIEKSDFYQFEIPGTSRLFKVIRDFDTAAFFPNDELLASLFIKDHHNKAKNLQMKIGSTKTILASGVVNNKLHAVLAVSGDQLTEKELPIISIFANQMAIAMQNAALYYAADQRADQLAGLNALAKITAAEYTILDVFTQAAPILRNLLNFDRFSLTMKMEDGFHIYSIGHQVNFNIIPFSDQDSQGYFGQVMTEANSKILNDIRNIDDFVVKKLIGLGIRSVMISPVISGAVTLGTINMGSKQLNAYCQQDLDTLNLIVDHLAPLIDKAVLYRRIQESESRFRSFFEKAAVGILIHDWRKKVWEPNPAFLNMMGYDESELELLQQLSVDSIKHPDDLEKHLRAFDDLKSGKIRVFEDESRFIKKNGELIWVKTVISLVHDIHTKKPVYTIVILEDISARKQIEAAVIESEQKYKTLFEVSVDAIFIIDRDGLIRDANPAALNMLGRSFKDIKNMPFLSFLPEEDKREFDLLGKRLMFLDIEHLQTRLKAKTGEIIDVEINTRSMNLRDDVLQVIVRDITQQKIIESELKYLGTHDMLTGLYNRNYFELEMSRFSNGRMYPISIIVIDVDGLKITNDTQGHTAGDLLLKRTAQVLKSVFRSEDIVARWGGDEFSVLLPLINNQSGQVIVSRIRKELDLMNQKFKGDLLSFSIGLATATQRGDLNETIKQADAAMYEEKRLKRTKNKNPGIRKN